MLRWPLFFMIMVFVAGRGEEIVIPGSESPNHRYEVYAVDPRAEGAVAHLEIRAKSNGKIVFDLGASGWVVTAKALALPVNTAFAWTPDSRYFAMMLRSGKDDSEVVVYRVADEEVDPVELPDISEAIHKEVKFDNGRFYYESIVKWQDPQTLLVKITGNTIDAVDEDDTYVFAYEVAVNMTSLKITKVTAIKKALVPPPVHAEGG